MSLYQNTIFQETKSRVSLKEYANHNLERKGRCYICPNCGSGKGPDGTPAFSITNNGAGNNWKCFSCGKGGDIFDLAAIVRGLDKSDKRGQLEEVARFGGIPLEQSMTTEKRTEPRKPAEATKKAQGTRESRNKERDFIARAKDSLESSSEAISYLQERGISLEQAKTWGIGYDISSKRIVVPWKGCDYYHADRDITGKSKIKYRYPKSEEVGPRPLYNADALSYDVVFVTEGALDALAVEGCGYEAIALGSNRNRLLAEQAGTKHRYMVFVLLLDNDEAGEAGAEAIKEELKEVGITSIRTIIDGYKDAAEAWQKDRNKLSETLSKAYEEATKELEAKKESDYASTLESLRAYNPFDVASSLFDIDNLYDPVETRMTGLDGMLGGGLYNGLIILGAVSSLGKTTFSLQVADSIAASGKPVLFVTIEQSAQEIVAKSIARIMKQRGGYAASAQEITSRRKRSLWKDFQYKSFMDACNEHTCTIADNMVIYEGRKQPTVEDIKRVARIMADRKKESPVVFIDYLQLLAPKEQRDGTKEATDHNITELRQMARELQTPVFAISSLNRSSYGKGVTLDSFKESGAIEYGADVLLGLQPAGMTEKLEGLDDKAAKKAADKDIREHKKKVKRECELVVLKQRNWEMPKYHLNLTFHTDSGLFSVNNHKKI